MATTVPANSSRAFSSTSTDSMSRWFVGSSSTSRSGGRPSAAGAVAACARRPRAACSHAVPARTGRGTSSAGRHRPPPKRARRAARCPGDWTRDRACPDPARGTRSRSTAPPTPRPSVGSISPTSIFSSTDFPAPLSPTTPTRSPCMTVRSMPASTGSLAERDAEGAKLEHALAARVVGRAAARCGAVPAPAARPCPCGRSDAACSAPV